MKGECEEGTWGGRPFQMVEQQTYRSERIFWSVYLELESYYGEKIGEVRNRRMELLKLSAECSHCNFRRRTKSKSFFLSSLLPT